MDQETKPRELLSEMQGCYAAVLHRDLPIEGILPVDLEAEQGFRSISVPVRRDDNTVIAAANIEAHVDRITTGEVIDRFLPLLKELSETARPLLV